MENVEQYKSKLDDELAQVMRKGSMSSGDLDAAYKLIVSIEKLEKIEEMEGSGYSQAGGMMMPNYRNGNSYGYGNSYGNGNSYANGRAGTHYVRGHYSRGNGEDMGMIMDEIMNDPNTPPQEKETLRKAVDILQR